jgi:hypothetical protein
MSLINKVSYVINHRLRSEIKAVHIRGIRLRDWQFQGNGYGCLEDRSVSSHFVLTEINYSKLGELRTNCISTVITQTVLHPFR